MNGHAVESGEFRWFMEQERAGVFQYFKTTCDLEFGKGFWTRECAGTTPRKLLQEKTIERVIREKIEQILFMELELIRDVGYSRFLENLEKLNREREAAVKDGRVIYGPIRFSQLQYYGHWKAMLQLEAKRKLAEGRLVATDQELRAFYEESKERFRAPNATTFELVTIQLGPGTNTMENLTLIKKFAAEMEAGHSVEEARQRAGVSQDVEFSFRRFEALDDDRIGELLSGSPELAQVAALAPGRCISSVSATGSADIVKCISRTGGNYRSFDEVKERVRTRYLDRQYEQLLDEMVKKAIVERDLKVIDSLSPPYEEKEHEPSR